MIKGVTEPELVAMRAKIVETLLSWAKGQPYFVDQLRKKMGVTKWRIGIIDVYDTSVVFCLRDSFDVGHSSFCDF